MFSKNSHGYCAYAHTVRVKDLLFYLYHLYVYVFGQWISVTPVTPVTLDFLKVSRVLGARIMRMGVTRTHLHGTR